MSKDEMENEPEFKRLRAEVLALEQRDPASVLFLGLDDDLLFDITAHVFLDWPGDCSPDDERFIEGCLPWSQLDDGEKQSFIVRWGESVRQHLERVKLRRGQLQ